jgi:para-nitrobenzyl esterase
VDHRLSASIQTYWTNFAKTGNPNSSGLSNWPAWSDKTKEFLEIDKSGTTLAKREFPPLFSSLSAEYLRKNLKAK